MDGVWCHQHTEGSIDRKISFKKHILKKKLSIRDDAYLIVKVDPTLVFSPNATLLQSSNTCNKEITFLKAPSTITTNEIWTYIFTAT